MIVGAGVSEGIGISRAKVIRKSRKLPDNGGLNGIIYELDRFDYCRERAVSRLNDIAKKLPSNCRAAALPLIERYTGIIGSSGLVEDIKSEIIGHGFSAEYAIVHIMERYKRSVESLDDQYLSGKSQDIEEISSRLLENLIDSDDVDSGNISEECIAVSYELTMTDILSMDFCLVKGIVTVNGGPGSGGAVIARLLNIPAVFGAGDEGLHIKDGDMLVVDANCGTVIINPDEHKLKSYMPSLALQ